MLEKTAEKLRRRLESKPLHHIDTAVIIEPEKTIDGRLCRKYLQKIDYNYRGAFSSPVLSELFMSMIMLKDSNKAHAFLAFLMDMKNARNIEFYTPIDIHIIATRIKEVDDRLDPTDIDIVACAIENKAANLVTLDKDLIENIAIEKEFGLKIMHPKRFL